MQLRSGLRGPTGPPGGGLPAQAKTAEAGGELGALADTLRAVLLHMQKVHGRELNQALVAAGTLAVAVASVAAPSSS